ncbi:MAG: 50S ribosomal protein L25/general stress protein Ctc [Propionibacteriaceae bacterium]|nr:50S ribosomal protein L25/general stress protein Ctc [Propionibacteriaceae bacterium]
MADIKQLAAKSRTEFGKGAARRTRRAGFVPAVLYGHGTDPIHISLPSHDTFLALRVANALLAITIDGKNEQLALPKQVARNPVKDYIEHVDLIIVKRGEKVRVEVPLLVVDDDRSDAITMLDRQTIALEVEATKIPAGIEVSVKGLEIGDTIIAEQLTLPEGAVLAGEADELILSIMATRAEVSEAEAGEETAGDEEAPDEAE